MAGKRRRKKTQEHIRAIPWANAGAAVCTAIGLFPRITAMVAWLLFVVAFGLVAGSQVRVARKRDHRWMNGHGLVICSLTAVVLLALGVLGQPLKASARNGAGLLVDSTSALGHRERFFVPNESGIAAPVTNRAPRRSQAEARKTAPRDPASEPAPPAMPDKRKPASSASEGASKEDASGQQLQPAPPTPPTTRALIATYKKTTSNYPDAAYAAVITIQTTDPIPHLSLSIGCDEGLAGADVEQAGMVTHFDGLSTRYSSDGRIFAFSSESAFERETPLIVTLWAAVGFQPLWVAIGDARDGSTSSPRYPIRLVKDKE